MKNKINIKEISQKSMLCPDSVCPEMEGIASETLISSCGSASSEKKRMEPDNVGEESFESGFVFRNGVLYFSRELERKVLFFMTMVMLLAGIAVKMGIF
ncbi:hypothetical protein [Desulfamplus magnetovallimortis]|nr:hypothetical protein [Desulfamplus magnetovallimortis]